MYRPSNFSGPHCDSVTLPEEPGLVESEARKTGYIRFEMKKKKKQATTTNNGRRRRAEIGVGGT
jgi:hypothetical protein